MIDIALDPLTRDLIIPIKPIDGAERIQQAVGIRLRTWLGEWFLDTSHGVPYLEDVLGKNKRPEMVEAILRSQILQVAGVKSIKSFNIEIDSGTRKSTVNFTADTLEGIIVGKLSV